MTIIIRDTYQLQQEVALPQKSLPIAVQLFKGLYIFSQEHQSMEHHRELLWRKTQQNTYVQKSLETLNREFSKKKAHAVAYTDSAYGLHLGQYPIGFKEFSPIKFCNQEQALRFGDDVQELMRLSAWGAAVTAESFREKYKNYFTV